MTILDLFRCFVIAAFIGLTALTIYRQRATIKNRVVLTREQALQKENDRLHRELAETKARAIRAEALVAAENPAYANMQTNPNAMNLDQQLASMRAQAMMSRRDQDLNNLVGHNRALGTWVQPQRKPSMISQAE